MMNLTVDCAIDVVNTGATAGTSAVQTSALDMKDYDGVVYIVSLGTVTSGSVMGAQVQDCATSGGTYANVGTAATVTDSGGATSNSVIIVEVLNMQKRYSELTFTRTTANAVVNQIIAIRHRSKSVPITQGSTVVAQAVSNAAS